MSYRRGFTLTELLIAITIIGILGMAGMSVYSKARNSARKAQTRGLITRLHYVVMGQYDAQRTRRLNLSVMPDPKSAAWARLHAVREILRYEFPDRWSDVVIFGSGPPALRTLKQDHPLKQPPILAGRYHRIVVNAWRGLVNRGYSATEANDTINHNAAAECLYMIIMSIPYAAENFGTNDSGDVDQDGLPEFHDAWGRPIRFLRWAPGFIDSDLQHIATSYEPSNPAWVADNPDWSQKESENHDPLDPRRLDMPTTSEPYRGTRLLPLIYSAGVDGIYDINIVDGFSYDSPPDPYAKPKDHDALIGEPFDKHGDGLNHYDNIHNHQNLTAR
jgi:prepilin-type N-terminal cleavage/methylation domain-containing protein